MNQAKLSRIEGQEIGINDFDLYTIAKALNVTVDELFNGEYGADTAEWILSILNKGDDKMDGKEEFMAALYQNNYKRLENYCLCYINYDVQYRDLIDECLQEVMLQAASDYDEIYEYSTSHLSAWLMNTCQNRFSTALRKYRRRFKRHAYSLDDDAYYESFAISSDNIQEFLE